MLPENGYTFDQAFGMARKIFHYTNHTVMPEALEKWDCNLVQQLLPAVYDIILRIEEQFMTECRTAWCIWHISLCMRLRTPTALRRSTPRF